MRRQQKQRQALTDAERINIALARILRLQRDKKWPSPSDLAKDFNRHPSVISRAFTAAFRDGLLEVRPARHSPPKRVPRVEAELLNNFPKLRSAVVIESAAYSMPGPLISGLPDDALHAALGQALADHLRTSIIFRDGDVIGVGSGRGVGYTLEALHQSAEMFRAVVTIMSLAGSFHSRNTQRKYWLDADTHATLLASCFRHDDVMLNLVRHPLTYPKETPEPRKATLLSDEQWTKCHPTIALLGVGIVAPSHRFYEEALRTEQECEPIVVPIHKELRKLVNLCQQSKTWSVADTSNHLFFVPSAPAKLTKREAEIEEEVKGYIDVINQRVIALQDHHFKDISSIVLIAGTVKKVRAILELLTNDRYNVRCLCTDEPTARELVNLRRE